MNELLVELRDHLGISQSEFAKSIGLSQSGYSLIENGKRDLNDRIIKLISAEFNVSEKWLRTGTGDMLIDTKNEDLKELERKYNLDQIDVKIIQEYLKLSPENRKIFKDFLTSIYDETVSIKEKEIIPIHTQVKIISRPLYDLPASAGNGQFLDGSHYEMMDFPADTVPPNSTFCVRIAGDSMEPEYHDHDIVFVRQMPTIKTGEIGVFVLNGEGFIKKYCCENDKCCLVSLNPDYTPIEIKKSDQLKVVGKVVSVKK